MLARFLSSILILSMTAALPLAASADPHGDHDGRQDRDHAHYDRDDRPHDNGHHYGWRHDERHRFWDRTHHHWYYDEYRTWDPDSYHWVPDGGNYLLVRIHF